MSEDILKLTPGELWVWIAKRLGWVENFGRMDNASRVQHFYWTRPDNTLTLFPSPWTTDLTAAFALVEEAAEKGIGFDLFTIVDAHAGKHWYGVTFYSPAAGPLYDKYSAEEDTAPLAISRAWALMKQAQDAC
jgi:hypothetical protein